MEDRSRTGQGLILACYAVARDECFIGSALIRVVSGEVTVGK